MMAIDQSARSLSSRVVGTFLAMAVLASLVGCAGAASTIPGTYPDVSLTETKSPAQLLRNEAANRLPAEIIDEKIESEDASVACLSEQDDPEGLIRSWHSTVDATILDDTDVDVSALVKDLADSFADQGWTVRSLGGSANVTSKLLESDDSLADIQISGLEPDPDRASTGLEDIVEQLTVQIQVHGPCVRTDGSDSDEVKSLENR